MSFLPWREAVLVPGKPFVWTSVTVEEATELRMLAVGRRCLEIGSAFGFSACIMALGGAVSVLAVDPHKPHATNEFRETMPAMQANLETFGAWQVRIVQGASGRVLARLEEAGQRFGLVFIDGDHEQAQVEQDVGLALRLLEPGGALAAHDYGNDNTPGVTAALDGLCPVGPTRLVNSLWVLET